MEERKIPKLPINPSLADKLDSNCERCSQAGDNTPQLVALEQQYDFYEYSKVALLIYG